MNKKFILLPALLLLVVASVVPTWAQSKRSKVYGVMFYNLENLFDTINNNGKYDLEFSPNGKNQWTGKRYKQKIHNMAYAISKMTTRTTPEGPAVIGVSEVENKSVLLDLVADPQIAARGYKVIHHDSPDRRGIDVSLLYNPRFFRPLAVTNHTLTIDSMPYFRTRDQMCVVGLMGGARVAIIVNHWPSRRGGKEQSFYLREAAANLTRHIADSLLQIDPNMGIIMMGDLNDSPYDKSMAEVLKAKKKKEDVAAGEFFNPFWQLLDKGIGSYIYRSKWDLFDQIVVNYNLINNPSSGLQYFNAVVHNDEFLKQQDGKYKGYPFRTFSEGAYIGGYSDHFPTEIFLKQDVE